MKFAWTVLGESPAAGPSIVADEIKRFADVHAPGRYHETITQFWVTLVSHTRAVGSHDADFDSHVARYPLLLDKSALGRHHSAAVLGSEDARSVFVEPDLLPFP